MYPTQAIQRIKKRERVINEFINLIEASLPQNWGLIIDYSYYPFALKDIRIYDDKGEFRGFVKDNENNPLELLGLI